MRQAIHIFRKDARHCWPYIAAVVALTAAHAQGQGSLEPPDPAKPSVTVSNQRPAFEVASVKLNSNCGVGGGVPAGTSPGRLNTTCATLRGLIRMAYGAFAGGSVRPRVAEVLGGPGWLDSDHYEISAKAEGDPPRALMMGPMLQTLLEDRFKVRVHTEFRDTPVYALTVAKGDPKLRPSKEGSCAPMDLTNLPGRVARPGEPIPKYCGTPYAHGYGLNMISDGYGMTMAEFAGRMLSGFLDRPVVDKTGLTGRYDIHLEFVRGDGPSGSARVNGVYSPDLLGDTSGAEASGPSIFTAMREQLGLRLVPDKSPLEVIVVDNAERPSGN